MQVSAATFGQRITINQRNASLETVLKEIRKQSGYSFIYDVKTLNQTQKINVVIRNASIEDALKKSLDGLDLAYEINGKVISIKKKEGLPELFFDKRLKIIDIKGKVVDEGGKPIPSVSILIKGTKKGTYTNENGDFSISILNGEQEIIVSAVGFVTQTIIVGNQTSINIVLKENKSELSEVVVVGYGTQKKSNLTGAVSVVSMDKVLGDRPVANVGSALQGAVPGLTVSGGANPGASKSINIRGITSINGGSPLILVDNVVTTNLDLINPADIETVSVLKDAASAAIYGARASFGVVIITTKKGKKNQKTQLTYNGNFAFEKPIDIPEKASPIETIQGYKDMGYTTYWSGQNVDKWLGLIKQYNANPGNFPEAGWVEDEGYRYFLKSNDEIKDMTSGAASKYIHNISASGGSEHIAYRFSLGRTSEDGILITNKDAYKRTNVSAYVNADINRWVATSLDVKYANGYRTTPKNSGEFGLFGTSHPSYYPKDSLPYNGVMYPVNTPSNIIRNSDLESWLNKNTRVFSRTELSPLNGLKGYLEYTYETNIQDHKWYNNLYWLQRGVENALDPSDQSTAYFKEISQMTYKSLNAYLTHEKTFLKSHTIKLTAGFNQEESTSEGLSSKNYYMISNGLPSISGGTGIIESKDRFNEYAIRSGFYRLNYNFKDKYLLEANGRYDGSSKFPADHRYGFFPSVSAGWVLSRESFMESFSHWMNTLKVRASYGSLGNQSIDDYQFYSVMSPYQPFWISNGLRPTSLTTPGLVRKDFTWEKVNTIDIGVDVAFLGDRFSANFDWYERNTLGMLAPGLDFPAVVGVKAPLQNAADLKTKGWEFSIQWRDKIGDWRYSAAFNLYNSRSVITRYRNENKVLSDYYEGMELGEVWGYVTDGFYTADDFEANGALKKDVVAIQGVISHEGDIKYKNLMDDSNSTNQIDIGNGTLTNSGDRKVIGNNSPRYNFGFNASVGWKNLDLSILLQGVAKRDYWIGGDLMFPHAGKFSTFNKYQLDYWTPEHKDAYYGRLYKDAGESHAVNQRVQTKFLQNASYLRVKNVSLSYVVPKSWFGKIPVTGARIFFSGENMLTFTKLIPGLDPELLSWQYPQMATYSFGINVNF
ncbi:TonB-linked outer membrane protein, SusC/RagA family [Pedobacter steynii]|uniref:TonB-linked outer membrane protein, SusC/RagA family n=1 Tax=Pedobacter steynii TaxID=430522 RepID=A0A1H0G2W2_9SPHI|nr:TonB-dependent receptor [Pedobacter steynii]NQX42303.1 TonB-dependent receptor [Pedobacter steynii]SDO01171.1 TonB-linked outer membrane protein, SusC/RagA family [Pedobacter steynii]